MPRARLHIPIDGETGEVGRALCGRPAVLLGEPPDCAQCLRALKSAPRRVQVSHEEWIRDLAHLLAGPPVALVPPLTPDVWREMRRCCAGGDLVDTGDTVYLDARRATHAAWEERGRPAGVLRGHCPVCRAESDGAAAAANWRAEQEHRPHRRYEHVFGSYRAMLQAYARHERDGASARSSTGTVTSRLSESAKLGTAVQTTQRFDRDDLPTRRADHAIDAERFLRRAFAQQAERRGLTVERCMAIVVASDIDGVPATRLAAECSVSPAIIRALLKHGRRVFTIEAAASGYIPEPRAETGLVEAVRKRRAEMGESE